MYPPIGIWLPVWTICWLNEILQFSGQWVISPSTCSRKSAPANVLPSAIITSLVYGVVVSFSEIEPMAGGLKYVYTAHIEPPLSCPGTTMSESMDFEKAKLMARRFGFGEWKKVVEDDGEVIGRDPEFWAAHFEDPVWICVEAMKIEG